MKQSLLFILKHVTTTCAASTHFVCFTPAPTVKRLIWRGSLGPTLLPDPHLEECQDSDLWFSLFLLVLLTRCMFLN